MTIKLNNDIYNINNDIYSDYINSINNSVYNKNIYKKFRNILKKIFTNDALNYNSNYLVKIIKISSIIFKNYENYKLIFKILDERKYNIKNNEYIFETNILCFKYIIKIISDNKNGINSSFNEIYNSIFIKNNFILTNVCPHFTCLITYIFINKYFNDIELKSSINYGLIFDYINPWTINIDNNKFIISSLEDLLNNTNKFKSFYSIKYINQILFNVFFQIFYSICALSKYKINHNDLRPANILIHGNYNNLDTYDKYTIITSEDITEYYLLNLGFKVKIIDFGLTNSDMIDKLNNTNSVSHSLVINAGMFKYYSEYYDIHYLINDILSRTSKNKLTDEFYDFLSNIIDKKYIGSYKSNKYINQYWRLGFPFTIKEYVKLYSLNINLTYEDNKLIIDDNLLNNLTKHIQFISKHNISECITTNLKDPLDNNNLKKPLEVLKLFKNTMIKYKDYPIMNNYLLDFINNNINLDNILE
jgi:hypothetical protein